MLHTVDAERVPQEASKLQQLFGGLEAAVLSSARICARCLSFQPGRMTAHSSWMSTPAAPAVQAALLLLEVHSHC
jgi:hypothetical protein